MPEEAVLNLANAYYITGLYDAAVDQYRYYLVHYSPVFEQQANTYYTIANIYFDRKHDYSKALEYYFKIKYLFPESHLQGEVTKRIVTCLERLGRPVDASRTMESSAALKPEPNPFGRPGEVVASIGPRDISTGDIEFEISRLAPQQQSALQSRESRLEFVRQLVLREILYNSARRMNLDENPEIVEQTHQNRKSLMVDKVVELKLQETINISADDVELFYLAHKERYVEKDKKDKVLRQIPLGEIFNQVAEELAMDRKQQAYQRFTQELMNAEKVRIYDHRVQ